MFFTNLENTLNATVTDNGAPALTSTLDPPLDFFSKAVRNDITETTRLFRVAFNHDPETAMRTLFYFRDIRNGQGERKFPQACLKELADHPKINEVIKLIPEYGYWKDLWIFHGTNAWGHVVDLVQAQLEKDLTLLNTNNAPVSLLGKWMPSANAGKASQVVANTLMNDLGYTPRRYRKMLSDLRERIKIVESLMCKNQWSDIDYSTVPSKAAFMYRRAFVRRDPIRYKQYLSDVADGKTKINAATLYPSDIMAAVRQRDKNAKNLDVLWKALPNYIDSNYNGIVIADTSGSMANAYLGGNDVEPIDVSIALAIYIAERNPSPIWKNKFIIFSADPELLTLRGNSITEYYKNFTPIVSSNTNLLKVAKILVKTGKDNNLPNEDMPKFLTIISDMQFDGFEDITGGNSLVHDIFVREFTSNGYTAPQIIYWNVNNNKNVPIKYDTYGTCIVTGFSPVIMKSILKAEMMNPIEIMRTTVYNSRYDAVGKIFSATS